MRDFILHNTLIGLLGLCVSFQSSAIEFTSADRSAATEQPSTTIQHLPPAPGFLLEQSAQSCLPFCINPVALAEGVATVDELDLLKFMETQLRPGTGLLVDARSSSWYQRGSLPGAVNIPCTVFETSADDATLAVVFNELGVRPRHDVNIVVRMLESIGLLGGDLKTARWDFTSAKELVLLCNDPWCGQSPRAIKALLSHGYPAEKLYYYRGGLQTWEALGLSTQIPASDQLAAN